MSLRISAHLDETSADCFRVAEQEELRGTLVSGLYKAVLIFGGKNAFSFHIFTTLRRNATKY